MYLRNIYDIKCVVFLALMGCCGCGSRATADQTVGVQKMQELERELTKARQIAEEAKAGAESVRKDLKSSRSAQEALSAELQRVRDDVKRHTVYRPEIKPEIKLEPKIEFRSPPPPPPLPAPSLPPKKAVDIFLRSVDVYSTKTNGRPWDTGNGDPDLTVYFANLSTGETFSSGKVQDSLSASFNDKAIRVSEGDTIRITVSDEDAFDDDSVGTITKEFTAGTMTQGRVYWAFDRVSSLVLDFQP